MKTFQLRQLLIGTAIVVVPLALLNVAFAGKCCNDGSGCSGCVQVSSDPPRYVDLGSNTVKKCASNSLPTTCDEEQTVCFSGTSVNVYDAGCANVIGTTTFSMSISQCDSNDDLCSSEG